MELDLEFPVYRRHLRIVSGSGVWLLDADGRRYLDMYGGHAVASFGYGNSELTECMRRTAEKLIFQSNAVNVAVRDSAVQALSAVVPGGPWRILLVNSGAEANENALRLALAHSGRQKVAAVQGAFHGRTAAAAAVTEGSASWYGFPRTPFEVVWLNPNDPGSADQLDESVAAVIVEPVQGVAGARDLSDAFLAAVQSRAMAHGVCVIADEVQSGMGRTGYPVAFSQTPLRPDIVTLGKAIAAGFPAAAVQAKPALINDLKIGQFGTTFGGGPMACAMIAEVCCHLEKQNLLERVRSLSDRLQKAALGRLVTHVQGKGFLLGLRTTAPAAEVQRALLDQSIIVGDSKDPHIIRLLPPLILEDTHVDHFLHALQKVGN